MTLIGKLIVALGALALALGMAGGQTRGASHQPEPKSSKPWFVLYHMPGNSKNQSPSGLEIALWDDGTVLRSPDPRKPGVELEAGSLAPEEMQTVRDELRKYVVIQRGKTFVVPGASFGIMAVTEKDERPTVRWDEQIKCGWGANVRPTPEYREMVAGWIQARISLAALIVQDPAPVKAKTTAPGEFRGYLLEHPEKTSWLVFP